MPLAGRLRAPRLRAMKSAYELAMERLEKRDGKGAALSAAQKKAIAEIDEKARAAVAELEILLKPQIAAAAAGDPAKAAELEEKLRRGIDKARRDAGDEKDAVRRGG